MNDYNYKLSSRLETKWISTSPYNLQSDIYQVYQKSLFHSVTVKGKNNSQMFIEASSFPNSKPKIYSYGEGIVAESKKLVFKDGKMTQISTPIDDFSTFSKEIIG